MTIMNGTIPVSRYPFPAPPFLIAAPALLG